MSAKSNVTIGWIGLGNMGKLMSGRLLEADYPLVVYNRTKEKTRELVEKGAKVADSPAEVASQAEITFTMVTDSKALEDVTLNKNGAFEGSKPGSIFIDMSTVSPESSAKVAEAAKQKGIRYLRAPVSGSTPAATAGTLGIMVSGDEDAHNESLELFKVIGQKVFYLGPAEEARYMKLAVNIIMGAICQILSEALVFGKKAGLDWGKMLEVITNSSAAAPLISYKVKPILERNFSPTFTINLMAKDFDLALAAGKDLTVPLPVASLVKQCLASAQATGKGELDFVSLVLLAEEHAGIKE